MVTTTGPPPAGPRAPTLRSCAPYSRARADAPPPRAGAPAPSRGSARRSPRPGWPSRALRRSRRSPKPGPHPGPAKDYRLSVDRRPTAVLPLPTHRMRIGRAPDNELVLSDLTTSGHHAELRKTSDGKYQIVDLGSHNGTFVNGQPVTSATLTEKDIVSIGPATFRLVDGTLREYIDTGDVSLVAQDLVVEVSGGKILLNHVSFPLGERSLVGVIGPSGAGKSTLLGALTGMRPADRGVVLYDNRDLYQNYAELRTRIGLVPQDSVMHTQLTTQRALQYGAELRFPPDTGSDERTARVEEVMGELGLTRHADTRADRLSGGQLKRVNVALELLTKPSLLFLDEPTSGLDPGLDKSVMEQMRDLAHDGRTVIVVTHSVANLNALRPAAGTGPRRQGRVLRAARGGAGLLRRAGLGRSVPDLRPGAEPGLGRRVQGLPRPRRVRHPAPGQVPAVSAGPKAAGTPAPVRGGAFSQIGTLCRRYTRVLASDRWLRAVRGADPDHPRRPDLRPGRQQGLSGPLGSNANAQLLLIMVIVGVCLSSTVGSIRELVKERNIYIRERAAGLSSAAYLGSKLIVLGLVSVVQAAIMG